MRTAVLLVIVCLSAAFSIGQTAGGSLRGLLTLTFNPWSINMTFDYTGDGTAYGTITPEPHPYNCLSTLAIEFETVTYTLTPS